MTKGDLQQMVAKGEGLRLEFKHSLPEGSRIAREITALANTRGGYLLVGVSDDGDLTGVKDFEEQIYALNQALEQFCVPSVSLELESIKVSRTRTALVVKIPLSSNRPHYVQNSVTRKRIVFVRFEDMCIVASQEAQKLMRKSAIDENILITLGEKERLLLKQLELKEKVTVKGFAKYAKIHPGRASRILIRMTRAKILAHHIDPEEDYFTAGVSLSTTAVH